MDRRVVDVKFKGGATLDDLSEIKEALEEAGFDVNEALASSKLMVGEEASEDSNRTPTEGE